MTAFRIILIFLLLSFLPLTARAQSSDYAALETELASQVTVGRSLAAAGSPVEAVGVYRRCLETGRRFFAPDQPAVRACRQALAALLEGPDPAEAADLYRMQLVVTRHEVAARVIDDGGDIADAEAKLRQALGDVVGLFGGEHPYTAWVAAKLARLLSQSQALDEMERLTGEIARVMALHPESRAALAIAYEVESAADAQYNLENYDRAARVFEQAIAIREPHAAPNDFDLAWATNQMGMAQFKLGRLAAADAALTLAVTRWRLARGVADDGTRTVTGNLVDLLEKRAGQAEDAGRLNDVQLLRLRLMPLVAALNGEISKTTGRAHEDLAVAHMALGLYSDAAESIAKSINIYSAVLGAEHEEITLSLLNLSTIYIYQGRNEEARGLIEQVIARAGTGRGGDPLNLATAYHNLASVHKNLGEFDQARGAWTRALELTEAAVGTEDADYALSLSNLAGFLTDRGQFDLAEEMYGRVLEIRRSLYGAEHASIARGLHNMGILRILQDRQEEAADLFERALDIMRAALGDGHPDLASILMGRANVLEHLERNAEAEAAMQQALAIREERLPPLSYDRLQTLNNLATFYIRQDRFAEAEDHLRRALDIQKAAQFQPTIQVVDNLATALFRQGKTAAALAYSRQALVLRDDRRRRSDSQRDGKDIQVGRGGLRQHLSILKAAGAAGGIDPKTRLEEGFLTAQRIQAGSVAKAMERAALRAASGPGLLGETVRRHQDLQLRLGELETSLARLLAGGDDTGAAAIRRLRNEAETEAAALQQRLAREFPAFDDLSRSRLLRVGEAQDLLGSAEALLVYAFTDEGGHLWLVRRDSVVELPIDATREQVTRDLSRLRERLTFSATGPAAYPARRAYRLYQTLLAPAEAHLGGIEHLIVAGDGALQSFPLGALMTEQPARAMMSDPVDLAAAPWLARQRALTVLPSVSSLWALRRLAVSERPEPGHPFTGIGDPVLKDRDGAGLRGISGAQLFRSSNARLADVSAIRELVRLPETAEELETLARTLGAGSGDVVLGAAATEAAVKSMDLSDSRIIAFATHGVVADDFDAGGEPGLILTPPSEASALDDGLLTAGEVAALKLNADWVVLSACNTAAPDGSPGGEGLSGLARAFFYAGAETLLVSHWPVESNAAKALTTRLFEIQAADPGTGRAEALRQARLFLIGDRENPHYAHPFYWAPFVVVGEGGLGQSR